jgi:glucose dehydrogenase
MSDSSDEEVFSNGDISEKDAQEIEESGEASDTKTPTFAELVSFYVKMGVIFMFLGNTRCFM